jgi:electron transfer flavoprotein alpha/beta subunit
MAVKVEIGEGKATVEREIEGAHEVWETSLPAVISAQKGLNEPRYASLKGIMAAKKKTIETKDAASLGLKPEDLKPKTRVGGTRAAGVAPRREDDPGRRGRPGEGAAPAPARRGEGTLMPTIVTFAEVRDGKVRRPSLEAVSEARRLAGPLGATVQSVLIGQGVAPLAAEVASYGADRVHVFDDAELGSYATESFARALAQVHHAGEAVGGARPLHGHG